MINSVSLCMVVYNEAHRIKDTLDRIYDYVDEIVIVDQSSTDGTGMEIAKYISNKARGKTYVHIRCVSDKHWGYCEPSRPLAHAISTGDWVLILDADERVSEEFLSEMRTIDEMGYFGAALLRPLYINGVHQHDGNHIYRYSKKSKISFSPELHTAPSASCFDQYIYNPSYPAIYHEKSWKEQVVDELAYEKAIKESSVNWHSKLALNGTIGNLRSFGLSDLELRNITEEEIVEKLRGQG